MADTSRRKVRLRSCIYPSSRAVLTNKRISFTGLRFEVEQQASRGLSVIAELLVMVALCNRADHYIFAL